MKKFRSVTESEQGYIVGGGFFLLALLGLLVTFSLHNHSFTFGTVSVLARSLDENTSQAYMEVQDVPDTVRIGAHIHVLSETHSMDLKFTTDTATGSGYILNYEVMAIDGPMKPNARY